MNYLDTRLKDIKNGYIQHFGILGMKWGIRKYQNQDGTLTEEGKKRYRSAGIDFKNKSNIKDLSKYSLNLTDSGFYKSLFNSDALIKNITKIKNDEYSKKWSRHLARSLFDDENLADIYNVDLYSYDYMRNPLPSYAPKIDLLHFKDKQDISFLRSKLSRGKRDYFDGQTLHYWDFDSKKDKLPRKTKLTLPGHNNNVIKKIQKRFTSLKNRMV